jgi:hypothetical protein
MVGAHQPFATWRLQQVVEINGVRVEGGQPRREQGADQPEQDDGNTDT